jgi:hypothetical protein
MRAAYSVEVIPSEGVGDDETAMRRCVCVDAMMMSAMGD